MSLPAVPAFRSLPVYNPPSYEPLLLPFPTARRPTPAIASFTAQNAGLLLNPACAGAGTNSSFAFAPAVADDGCRLHTVIVIAESIASTMYHGTIVWSK